MKKWIISSVLFLALSASASAALQGVPTGSFYFLAMAQPAENNDTRLKKAFAKIAHAKPAFVVLNGIKAKTESCGDELLFERQNLFNTSEKPVILSLSEGDWVNCRNSKGDSLAIERLIRLKEIFFENAHSLGMQTLELTRQSLSNRFSNYPENAYWQKNAILFATLHMPAENNHYITAAGRNAEFEDRTIANKNWLDRLFRLASRHRYKGIVLFSDGNPFFYSAPNGLNPTPRDGFYEIRQKLNALVTRYPGRVLFIHGQGASAPAEIIWKGRLGTLGLRPDWTRIDVNPATQTLFKAKPAFRKTSGGHPKTRPETK
ncbi:hypothetical protein [Oxalobacter paraformigenes]|uniref:Transmembrane protein n=1 Tax=Oxalobacter paraformigenes TaxID=556268 RepID=C3X6Q4_9BURK|nr:hypothetical protein [Oxalobacter paraformigenes]EEO28890.2 hypothetical protein OFAG_02043 [Oxalobacter paraformigenes]